MDQSHSIELDSICRGGISDFFVFGFLTLASSFALPTSTAFSLLSSATLIWLILCLLIPGLSFGWILRSRSTSSLIRSVALVTFAILIVLCRH